MKFGIQNIESIKQFNLYAVKRYNVLITIFNIIFFSCQSQNFHIWPQYDAVMPFKHGIAAVKQNGLWGIIDTTGNWIFKPRFTVANLTKHNKYIVEESNVEHMEVVEKDRHGQWILIPYSYEIEQYQTSLGAVSIDLSNQKYLLFDSSGNALTNPIYDTIMYIGEDLFIGNQRYKGDQLIHASGKIITPFYTEISKEIVFDRLVFKEDRYSGVLSIDGKVVVKPTWWLLDLAGKNIACTKGGNLKLYSETLEVLSHFEFNTVWNFENGNWVGRNTSTGESKIFNADGMVINEALSFGHEGMSKKMMAAGNDSERWGYVDANGKEVIPFTYNYAEAFMPGGYAIVTKESNGVNKKTIIDTTGKEKIVPEFNFLEWHSDGIYYLVNKDMNQLLDQHFNPITKLSGKPIAYMGNGVYIKYILKKSLSIEKGNFYTGDKAGIRWNRDEEVSSIHALDGSLLVDKKEYNPEDLLPMVSEGLASAKKAGKWGYIRCNKSNFEK